MMQAVYRPRLNGPYVPPRPDMGGRVNIRRSVLRSHIALLVMLLPLASRAVPPGLRPADVRPALERAAVDVRVPEHAALLAATRAGQRIVAVGERGVIVLSDDGGLRWRQAIGVPVSVSLTAVRFVDASNGWAVGHAGVILHTTDGGQSWHKQADGRQLARTALLAVQSLPTEAPQRKAAEMLVKDGPDKPLLDLHFNDALHGFVIGANNLFFKTSDGGATWQSAMELLPNPKSLHLYAIAADGDTLFIAGEQGLMMRSTDGGNSFDRLSSPYAGSWFTLNVPRPGSVFVAGLRGSAFFSSDQGASWQAMVSPSQASFVSAAVLPGGAELLANQSGQLIRALPGMPMTALPGPPLPLVAQVLPIEGGSVLAVGMTGVLRIPAGGPTPLISVSTQTAAGGAR